MAYHDILALQVCMRKARFVATKDISKGARVVRCLVFRQAVGHVLCQHCGVELGFCVKGPREEFRWILRPEQTVWQAAAPNTAISTRRGQFSHPLKDALKLRRDSLFRGLMHRRPCVGEAGAVDAFHDDISGGFVGVLEECIDSWDRHGCRLGQEECRRALKDIDLLAVFDDEVGADSNDFAAGAGVQDVGRSRDFSYCW
jgi:hypothetical protein